MRSAELGVRSVQLRIADCGLQIENQFVYFVCFVVGLRIADCRLRIENPLVWFVWFVVIPRIADFQNAECGTRSAEFWIAD
jgi:hypothetical protein